MKKKVLFVLPGLNIGGVEKSFINLINRFDFEKYDVYLKTFTEDGEFFKDLPNEVKVLKWNDENIKDMFRTFKDSAHGLLKSKKFGMLYNRVVSATFKSVSALNQEQLFWKRMKKYVPMLNRKFDVAIAYDDGRCTYYVMDKVEAHKKIAWIHVDHEKAEFNYDYDKQYYKKYDKVYAVSKYTMEIARNFVPENILDVMYNIQPVKEIRLKAKNLEGMDLNFRNYNGFKIVSVGRLSIEKGFDLAADVCKELLKNSNFDFKWYIIGEGNFRKELEKIIEDNNLQDKLILLGARQNPYMYIRKADVYAQTSRYEGFCTTIMEALILHKYVLTTPVSGTKEQIIPEVNGEILNTVNKFALAIRNVKKLKDEKEIAKANGIDSKNSEEEEEKPKLSKELFGVNTIRRLSEDIDSAQEIAVEDKII